MNERSVPIRWLVASLLVIAVLVFFFPLVSIHIPIMGDQEWSGYDVIVKVSDMGRRLDSIASAGSGETTSSTNSANPQLSDEPLSMRTLPLLPIEIGLAFVAAVLALLVLLRRSDVRKVMLVSFAGGIAAAMAVLHLTIANSDLHVWMQGQMKSVTQTSDDNPFSGFAKALGDMALNAVQLKPGIGLYVLGVALLGAAFLSRLFMLQPAVDIAEITSDETTEV